MSKLQNQDNSVVNIHEDHIASCLCCQKLSGSMGYSGYSEYTPGGPGSIECIMGEFSFEEDDSWYEVLNTIHNTARHCKLFVPVRA